MDENMVLPGSNSDFNTNDLTSNTFLDEIKSDNIKSTYLKESESFNLPMYIVDMSKAGVVLKTAIEGLKSLIISEDKLKNVDDEDKNYLYIMLGEQKMVCLGCIRRYNARYLLPNYIKSAFSDDINLYFSDNGRDLSIFKKESVSGVKLDFEY